LRPLRLGLTAAVLWSLASGPAFADAAWHFVQIICAPELSYFGIHRIRIDNLPDDGPYLTEGLQPGAQQVAAVQAKYGIFDHLSLKAHPFVCNIPAVPLAPGWDNARPGFQVRVVGHNEGSDTESTYRLIRDDVEIFLNGRSIAQIGLNPYSAQFGPVSVSVSPSGISLSITRCEIDAQASTADVGKEHLTCTSSSAPR
jgi:hypothetical protein